MFTVAGYDSGAIITSLLSAFAIAVLNEIYGRSIPLCSWVDCFGYLFLGCSVISVSFIICIMTLTGLHFCVGLDFVTLLVVIQLSKHHHHHGRISIILNDFENHRTESEYEDNLISKVFIFQLVNSFAALTYVSFIKYFLNIPCVKNNCIGDSVYIYTYIYL
jgi:hypothetical protein